MKWKRGSSPDVIDARGGGLRRGGMGLPTGRGGRVGGGLPVRLELQADCYSGVWATTVYEQGALEPGDLDEAFAASEAVGDDRLQSQAGGTVEPDSFTHGSSAQRRRWFENGYKDGDLAACDTFSVDEV